MNEIEDKLRLMMTLRRNGITSARLLQALEEIDRASYVEGAFAAHAYEDTALPICGGQTISQPSIVARMTDALEVTPRCKVLEIGTGSGYQAAVLSQLARRVYTIERYAELARQARARFEAQGLHRITVVLGDGTQGLPEQAPFDRILLTAAAEDPPGPLLAQLKTGGIMVLPVGPADMVQTLLKVVKTPHGLEYHELGEVRFVPLVEGLAQADEML